MAYPRHLTSRAFKKARRTSGSLTLNSTSWANVDTGLDLTLSNVQSGDQIAYEVHALWGSEDVIGYLDVVTVVSGTATNSFAERGAAVSSPGASCWYGSRNVNSPAISLMVTGTAPIYSVVAGDISGDKVTFRLRYATNSASNKTLYGTSSNPLDVWVMNLGPVQA